MVNFGLIFRDMGGGNPASISATIAQMSAPGPACPPPLLRQGIRIKVVFIMFEREAG
jgi:hypothetical protein